MSGLNPFVSTVREQPDGSALYFRCLAEDAGHASEQAQNAYPQAVVVKSMHDLAAYTAWVIYSPSEQGFWSNKLGWVSTLNHATRFNPDQHAVFNLPMSAGGDSTWLTRYAVQYLAEDARLARTSLVAA